MLGINLSRIIMLAAVGSTLTLLPLSCVHAEEDQLPPPLLLEEGGNLNFFDPTVMTINIQGRTYRIDPTSTRIIIISYQGTRTLPARQVSDLAARLERFRSRPLAFKSTEDGELELLVLDEIRATSSVDR